MLEHLTKETFKEKVFDWDKHKVWKFEGTLPVIVDFYAEWCGPCKTIAPILEDLQAEFAGKLNIYKVNTDTEQELSGMFNIQSIPSLLFIPVSGQPQMAQGALSKENFRQAIKEVLHVE